MTRDTADARWVRVRDRLRTEFGESVFRNWLKPLTLDRIEAGVAVMRVHTPFLRDRIGKEFGERLLSAWSAEDGTVDAIDIIVGHRARPIAGGAGAGRAVGDGAGSAMGDGAGNVTGDGTGPDGSSGGTTAEFPGDGGAALSSPRVVSAGERGAETLGKERAGETISAPLDSRFTFDNFVTGKPNELAFAAARRLAESEVVPFNPLFLYGGVGLGKTHLMHAIAWQIKQRFPKRRVLYVSAEKFMYQFIRALRFHDTVTFKEQFRSVDVLMIDDVQFISGKESTQEEFFHTFNALVDQNRQVVISADKSPSDLNGLEERLRSRLGWGLVADIHPTTYELRLGILQSKAEKLGTAIPGKVLEFLAHKITSNVRELEGAMNRIVAHSDLVGRQISLEMTQEVLHDLLRANDRRVTVDEIQRQVAQHFQIKISDMQSARRARAVARPRQVAMYLAKQLTTLSLPDIGRQFGGRDHTTVIHAVRKVDELRSIDNKFDGDVDLLRRMLES